MKLIYKDMGHILRFDCGCVNELVIENKRMFSEAVESAVRQSDGSSGDFVLSISDRPVEFGKYADVTVQLAPFQVNRKSLLTKLYSAIEKNAMNPDEYLRTEELLGGIERFILHLAGELPLEITCSRLSMGAVIKAVAPEIDEIDKSPLERIFDYMELVRELDRDKLFVMVNMRTYFSDSEVECFADSVCLHDFKVLLLEGIAHPRLKNVHRFTVDADLCEF